LKLKIVRLRRINLNQITNKEIREKLFELADSKYKEFHSSLCPNVDNIIGVRTPVLRSYAKELAKEIDADEYLKNADNQYYEEILLQGMIIGRITKNKNIGDYIKYIDEFVPKIYNWAICDIFCADLKVTEKNLEYVWKYIQKYLSSNKEFELRFAIVMMLDYYIKEDYIDEVLKKLDKIKNKEYYVQMAIAWAISIAFIKFPDQTMEYLKNNSLDNFTYNKAIQKIIESYRVDDRTKEQLRKMKRNIKK